MQAPSQLAGTTFKISDGVSRRVVAITCSECQEVTAGSDKPYAPLDVVTRHFAEKGFKVSNRGRHAICPKCQAKSRPMILETEYGPVQRIGHAPVPVLPIVPPTITTPIPETTVMTVNQVTAPIDNAKRLLALIPFITNSKTHRQWQGHHAVVAELVRLYDRTAPSDRLDLYTNMYKLCGGLRPSLWYFCAGLTSDGTRPWKELRAVLTAMGITLADHRTRKDRNRPNLLEPPIRTREESTADRRKAGKRNPRSMSRKVIPPSAVVDVPHGEPTREARRATARMYALLDQYFVVPEGSNVGVYAAEWSDDRVAKDSGLSVAEVVRSREDVYGRLAVVEDPRIEALESTIVTTGQSLFRDIGDLRKLLESLSSEVTARVAGFRVEFDALRKTNKVAG